MNSNSVSKRRKGIQTAAGALLVLALVIALVPLFSRGNVAKAVDVSTYSQLASAVQTANNTIRLTASIQMSFDNDYKGGGIHVTASGVTLNLNGYIIHTDREGEMWYDDETKAESAYGSCITVENGASLTINAGTSPTTAGISRVDRSKNAIFAYGRKEGQQSKDGWRSAGAGYVAIRNFGTVTVNSGVTIQGYQYFTSTDCSNKTSTSYFGHSCGIYNYGNATATVNKGAVVAAYSHNQSISYNYTGDKRDGNARTWAFGVFGGNINVNGGTVIAYARSYCERDRGTALNDWPGNADYSVYAYSVASQSGKINLNGGTFAFCADGNSADETGTGADWASITHGGMVLYGSTKPTIKDATTAPYGQTSKADDPLQCDWYNDDKHGNAGGNDCGDQPNFYTNYAVATLDSSTTWNQCKPLTRIRRTAVYLENGNATPAWPSSSSYQSEEGNSYAHTGETKCRLYYAPPTLGQFYVDDDTTLNSSVNLTWASKTNNGAAGMQNGSPCAYNASNTRSDPTYSRVHVFYRQWNAAGTSVDSISYAPFSGVNRITLSNCATYSTNYYWRTNTFSTASVAASAGTAINTNYFVGLSTGTSSPTVTVFTASNYANVDIYGSHSNDGATINTPVYVFVDYKKVAPRTVVAENIQNLAFDYDGEVFGASHTVHGSTTLNSVKFKYSGTSTYITDLVVNSFNFYNSTGIRQAAIEWENGSDNWTTANYPKNAGTYNFRIRLAADHDYLRTLF